jgi:hypothetical protein
MTNQVRLGVIFSTEVLAEKRATRLTKLSFHFATALILALSVASPFAHADAASARDGSKASANLNFRIVVPAIVRVKALVQALGVTVTQEDVERGHLDIDAASQLVMTSNSRNGYIVSANFDSEMLDKIEIKLPNKTLYADAGRGARWMHVNSAILMDEIVGISYRLYLKAGVKTGNYHWPVALAFMPNSGCATC